jgi:hypothetical protein
MKIPHLHFGLLATGAVAVILWILYEQNQQANALAPSTVSAGIGTQGDQPGGYPNIPQITPQSFDVAGLAPFALTNVPVNGFKVPTYNIQMPASATGGGGCPCEDGCDPAGTPVSSQMIPGWVVNQGAMNLQNFAYKLST